jgi:hypothetical protein
MISFVAWCKAIRVVDDKPFMDNLYYVIETAGHILQGIRVLPKMDGPPESLEDVAAGFLKVRKSIHYDGTSADGQILHSFCTNLNRALRMLSQWVEVKGWIDPANMPQSGPEERPGAEFKPVRTHSLRNDPVKRIRRGVQRFHGQMKSVVHVRDGKILTTDGEDLIVQKSREVRHPKKLMHIFNGAIEHGPDAGCDLCDTARRLKLTPKEAMKKRKVA